MQFTFMDERFFQNFPLFIEWPTWIVGLQIKPDAAFGIKNNLYP